MVNDQEYINKNYPDKTIKKLDISNKNLEGELDLSDFTELEELNCSNNQLTSLKFAKEEKITKLDIRDNYFAQKDLNFLSNFINLESLKLGRKRVNLSFAWETMGSHEDRHLNSFGSSLKPLKNMSKLKELSIINTDISEGLKYLPDNLEIIKCGTTFGRESAYQCSKIYEELKNYGLGNEEYDLVKWRENNREKLWMNWQEIYPDFTPELQQKWEEQGFDYEQTKKWVNVLGDYFEVTDYKFYAWLRDKKEIAATTLNYDELDNLKKEYNVYIKTTQRWLESQAKYNTKEKRAQVKELDIHYKGLEGKLNLNDFINLEVLNCAYNKLTNLNISNCSNIEKIHCRDNNFTNLEISNLPSLQELHCGWNKRLTILTVKNNPKLTELDCFACENLSSLIVKNNPSLLGVGCAVNRLTNLDFLNDLSKKNLTWLDIRSSKFITGELSIFNKFINLEKLYLESNHFTGSLELLKNLNKLEYLDISNTDIDSDSGLEYLPLSLKKIKCDGKIKEELELYNNNPLLWRIAHPHLMIKTGKEPVVASQNELKTIITTPKYLKEELSKNSEAATNYELIELNYAEFILSNGCPFSWKNESTTSQELPLRLYNLQTKQVESTHELTNITNYVALSYCWGTDWEKQPKKYRQDYQTDLTKLGRKALNKVIKTFELLNQEQPNLHHIWIDNFCINQSDQIEKGQEVAKQKQYYSNATATLIAIDAEVGKEINQDNKLELAKHITRKIFTSSWFKRSWTFQEGLLSKQTIFMLDDGLVDGRILALVWSNVQQEQLNTSFKVFVTPLGWSYGSQLEQKVNLTLGEALLAVTHREQTVPVDGIYSILGLLPYGNQIKAIYKDKSCSCDEEERKKCSHWPYNKEDLEQALTEVFKEAIRQGYGLEVFSWIGSYNGLWPIIPQVQKNGSTSIEKLNDYPLKNMQISLQGIQLESEAYRIDEIFPIDKGGKILIRNKKYLIENVEISKDGNSLSRPYLKTLPQIEVNDILVVISEKRGIWDCYLTIVIPSNFNSPTSLVELYLEGGRQLTPQKVLADLVNKRIIFGSENIKHYQQLIENNDNQLELTNFCEWNKWRIISPIFTEESVQQWKEQGFNYEQVYEWESVFKNEFKPQEIDFYLWLRDKKKTTAEECADEYKDDNRIKKSNSELRNQLIIDYWYPNNRFKQSQLCGGYGEDYKSSNDLITIGRMLNWTKIKVILIQEIKISYNDNYWNWIGSIQCNYLVKSESKWQLIVGKRHGYEREKSATIKLTKGEYLNKIAGWTSGGNNITSLTFYTTSYQGEEKKYGPYGDEKGREKFSLPINNHQQASVFYGKISGSLNSLGIQQAPHQITKEDLDLIAQIQVPPK